MKTRFAHFAVLLALACSLLLGCSAELDDEPTDVASSALGVPFTRDSVFVKGDLTTQRSGDSYRDLQAAQHGTPFVAWRIVRTASDPDGFFVYANRDRQMDDSSLMVDPEIWLVDENFTLISHNDDATSQTKYSRLEGTWGQRDIVYLVARNKTPTRLAFQRQNSNFFVGFRSKGASLRSGAYDLIADPESGLPKTTESTKPTNYLEHLEIASDQSWTATMHYAARPAPVRLAGPWYLLTEGRLSLYGPDTNGEAGFDLTEDAGILHVTYRYTSHGRMNMDVYDLASRDYASPLPYGTRKARGAWYLPDATLSTGYRMILSGASLMLEFSTPDAAGRVTLHVKEGIIGQGTVYSFPMIVDANDAIGEYVHVMHLSTRISRTPWSLTLHRSATDYRIVLEEWDSAGLRPRRRFEGTLPL